jgi:hypothetical protein
MFQHFTPLLLSVLSTSHCSQTVFTAIVVREDVPTDRKYKMVSLVLQYIYNFSCMPSAKLFETHVSKVSYNTDIFSSHNNNINISDFLYVYLEVIKSVRTMFHLTLPMKFWNLPALLLYSF